MTINIKLPAKVAFIINRLTKAGFDAFVVGGCVRDSIMGRTPHDWDICSAALPTEVKRIFEHVVPTGEKHGTVTVMLDGEGFEVTTFRTDGDYSDGRHPDNVEFTRSLEADLERRDFTINAMAYNPAVGLVDLFGGQSDIEGGVISCVGNPSDRFAEDALRMMRVVRFSAQLDFNIENTTFCSIVENASKITNVSFERIRDEIVKTITSNNPEMFSLFHDTGLLVHISPVLDSMFTCEQNNPHHVFNVARHSLIAMGKIKNELPFRLAMLLHDVGKVVTKTTDENGIDHFYGHEDESVRMAEIILARLKFDNITSDKVIKLIRFHMVDFTPTNAAVKRWMNRIGSFEEFMDEMEVKVADAFAQNPKEYDASFYNLLHCAWVAGQVLATKEVFNKANLAINGNDLIQLGVPQSRRMGEIIDALVEIVIDHPDFNTQEKLIEIVDTMDW
jgi:tRNA nucleotidyltransferase (CCA-adding enzyme)